MSCTCSRQLKSERKDKRIIALHTNWSEIPPFLCGTPLQNSGERSCILARSFVKHHNTPPETSAVISTSYLWHRVTIESSTMFLIVRVRSIQRANVVGIASASFAVPLDLTRMWSGSSNEYEIQSSCVYISGNSLERKFRMNHRCQCVLSKVDLRLFMVATKAVVSDEKTMLQAFYPQRTGTVVFRTISLAE